MFGVHNDEDINKFVSYIPNGLVLSFDQLKQDVLIKNNVEYT